MPNQYQRPDIPYNSPSGALPFSDRYQKLADNNQSPSGKQLDGDLDYIIDSINNLYDEFYAALLGQIPGVTDPTNIDKFLTTNGALASWTKITPNNFSANSVPETALQDASGTTRVLADGSVTNAKIRAGDLNNNNFTDNTLSFNKIRNENNDNFQNFFNSQLNGTLDGKKLKNASIPSAALTTNGIQGTVIVDNSLPAAKISPNSITSAQMALVMNPPIGQVIDWAGKPDAAVPAGYIRANGGFLNKIYYAALYAVIGDVWGVGTATNFRAPDLRGLSVFGFDAASQFPTNGRITSGTVKVAGVGGEENHTLILAETPSHTHGYNNPVYATVTELGEGPAVSASALTAQTSSIGGGLPHNNMPPYILMQKLVYAGV